MIKEIYERSTIIKYAGEVDELKEILKQIVKIQFGEMDYKMIEDEINKLEYITNPNKEFSSPRERVYYNNKRVIYRPNGSSKSIFEETIKPNSEKADRIFLSLDSKL